MADRHANWTCPKCQNRSFNVGEFHAAGGPLAKIFDVSNAKFSTVSCTNCGYTEIYRAATSEISNVFDLFLN